MSDNRLRNRCPEMMALLRYSEDSIFFKDMDGRFVMVSEAKAARSNVSWEEMVGKSDFDFLPDNEAQKCQECDIAIMESGESIIDKEEELTRPDGKKSWVSVSKFPWMDVSGEIIGVIGISRDITSRKAMQDDILRMLNIATHDMRSPIISIVGTVKALSRGHFGFIDESVKETLGDVFQRLLRLESVITNYLSVSSILGASVGEKELMDLRQDIIDPALERLDPDIQKYGITIDNRLGSIPGNEIMIKANKRLGIVYYNLIENAIKNASKKGTVKGGIIAFGYEERDKDYLLNVYNNGDPVPDGMEEQIFKKFESGTGSTGIGLSFSRNLMREYGGDLWYKTTSNGRSNFMLTLPKE